MDDWYMADFAWTGRGIKSQSAGLEVWRSLEGSVGRAYARSPVAGWTRLSCLQELSGASAMEQAQYHYVVETNVLAGDEAEFNAWYEQEHLPGLAQVPGTVRARRFVLDSGASRYLACYDLTTPDCLSDPAWLAVRHTDWSSRVRPSLFNTVRTMFVRVWPDRS